MSFLAWVSLAATSLLGVCVDFLVSVSHRTVILEYLNLENNAISGEIPSALRGLSELSKLYKELPQAFRTACV